MSSPGFNLLVRMVPAVAPALVRALLSTCSVSVHNRKVYEEYIAARKPYIGVVWHKDGELVARTLHRMGYRTVRGSSSTGGGDAFRELTAKLEEGWAAAIVADGPKGPARQSKLGPVMASRDTGVPMIPTLGSSGTQFTSAGFHGTPRFVWASTAPVTGSSE